MTTVAQESAPRTKVTETPQKAADPVMTLVDGADAASHALDRLRVLEMTLSDDTLYEGEDDDRLRTGIFRVLRDIMADVERAHTTLGTAIEAKVLDACARAAEPAAEAKDGVESARFKHSVGELFDIVGSLEREICEELGQLVRDLRPLQDTRGLDLNALTIANKVHGEILQRVGSMFQLVDQLRDVAGRHGNQLSKLEAFYGRDGRAA